MSHGIIVQFTCPKCTERHVTWECPTCGYCRSKTSTPTPATAYPGFYHVTPLIQRRDAIAAIMAEYAAAHPGATDANTNVLDVSLWLSSRREASAAE